MSMPERPRPTSRLGHLGELGGGAALFPLGVLVSLQLLDQAVQSGFNVLVPNVRQALGLSDAGILSIVAAAGAAALACTLPIAFLADRTQRVRLVLVGAFVSAGFCLGLGTAQSALWVAVMLAGASMGQAIIFPTHNSLLADYYPVRARPAIYSSHRIGLSLGAIGGVLLAGGLGQAFGWRLPFVVLAAPLALVGVIGLGLSEPRRGRHEQEALEEQMLGSGLGEPAPMDGPKEPLREPPPSPGEAWRLVWKIGVLRRIFVALPFLAAAIVGFTSLASLQYQRTFGLDAFQRAVIVAPVQVFDVLGVAVGAVVATRLARRSLRAVFGLLAVAAVAASGAAVLFALAPDVPLAFLGNALIDACLGVVGPGVLAVLSLAIPARARSVGFSVGALFVLPGLAVIPLVGTVGDAVGLRYGLLLLVPVFLFGAAIVYWASSVLEGDVRNVWLSLRARAEMLAQRRAGRLPLLAVEELSVGYDGVTVVPSASVRLAEGETVAILGTNGAGKSTLLRAIGGVVEADGGAVVFDGRDITHLPPDEVARLGVAQMPGGQGVFANLSVRENLVVAAWKLPRHDAETQVAGALERLAASGLAPGQRAGDLSGGQQQLLALAMALLARPRLLLIDELSLGLAPLVVEELLASLKALADSGTAVLLVEQSVDVALRVASRAYVMEQGQVRFEGTADELRRRPSVLRSIYLAGAARRARVAEDGEVEATGPEPLALEVRGVSVSFGGIAALSDVSLDVASQAVVGVVGPNGAGKSTLFDVVSGFARPNAGRVTLGGLDVTAWSPASRARAGLGRSFQDSRLFSGLTVAETLALALERFVDVKDPLNAALRLPAHQDTEAAVAERVEAIIELFGLERVARKLLSQLSTGTRRLVDLAAAAAHQPSVLLLDEPASGIAQREVEELATVLAELRRRLGATLIVVEHNMAFIASFAERLVALDRGMVVAEGQPEAVLGDPAVVEAFLGATPSASVPGGGR